MLSLLGFFPPAAIAQTTSMVLPGPASTSVSAVVQTAQVRAELVAHAPDGVQIGAGVWLGLQIAHQPHWHTYWKNPGDSGLPTVLQWELPQGVSAGEIAWPAPQKIAIGSLANYGYEGTVLLPVPLSIGKSFRPGALGNSLDIKLHASWLVCKEECVPQEGQFVLHLPLQSATALHGADFAAARAAEPRPLDGSARATLQPDGLGLQVSGLPASWQGKAINAFIETGEIIETAKSPSAGDAVGEPPGPGTQGWQNGVWNGKLPLSTLRSESPAQLPFVLSLGGQSVRTVAEVSGVWPQPVAPGTVAAGAATASAGTAAQAVSQTLAPAAPVGASMIWTLAAAMLGGLILNLMPCVFPVLAIKVLGFARGDAHQAGTRRLQGLAYGAGVVLSFVALGGLLLGLRAAGEQLGWGFQLQSPAVLTALAVLFTLIGLNLMGLLNVGMLVPSALATLQLRHPALDAFFSGVVAVAVASPCTAPFMGASLGVAITLPPMQALEIFAALGLGLALPYLAASWTPGVGHWLPRPGAWMDTLRRFMAFPMWATVVWLLWVLGHLAGVDAAAALLALLLGLALLIWALHLNGRSRHVVGSIAALLLVFLIWGVGPTVLTIDDAHGSSGPTAAASPGNANWQPWSAARVAQELDAGKPVFVDFTAAWCITCQYNKKTTLSRQDILADFATRQVTLLRADWTRRDPNITRALEQLGRTGVPVYVLYRAGQAPVVMSEILGADELHRALARL
jgi:thiol:disulfide interchange protein DsbD